MKNPKSFHFLSLLLSCTLLIWSCDTNVTNTTQEASCEHVLSIEGIYSGSGSCVITDSTGKKLVIKIPSETDTIALFEEGTEGLYQVNIGGNNNKFHEIEIGALNGLVLRTATAKVTDDQFPVLEEYIFDTDENCNATGFTKIVRNPTEKNFKACIIHATKN